MNDRNDIVFRNDAYSLHNVGQSRILYGRNIFSLSDKDCLVLTEDNGLAYYHSEKNEFQKISETEKEWTSFFPMDPKNEDQFLGLYQVNRNEFVSFHFLINRIVYFNRSLQKTIVSPLSNPKAEFSWESKMTMLNDTTFAINGGISGFYLYHINRQNGKIFSDGKKYLAGHKIQCLFKDKENRLWAGTSNGVLQQKLITPFMKSFLFQPLPADSISGGITSVWRHKDKLYAGRFSRNKGLLIIDTATMLINKTIEFFGKDNEWNEIRSIQMYHPDTLWITTNSGLLWLDTRTYKYGKLSDIIKNADKRLDELGMMAPARNDGYAWLCGLLNGFVARYHIETRTFTFFTTTTTPALPFEKVKSIAYDSYGDVWISGHSLARWNNQKQLFDTLISVYGGVNKYNDDILTISADKRGSLWLHNAENGLLQYIINEKKFVAYSRLDGLPSELLETFSPVIDDVLWIGSANHLTQFNTLTNKCIVYDYTDGFPDESPKSRRIYFDQNRGYLYMFCNNWLVKFPAITKTYDDSGSEITIPEIKINDNQSFFHPKELIRLKSDENNISILFSVIDFENNNYQFAYKLNNEQNWTSLDHQRNINFTSLSSGRYDIHLKATSKSGIEKYKKISFYIRPPFWKTAAFIITGSLLLITIGIVILKTRIKQIRQKANLDRLLARTEMKALHAQMNPHFISNSLNSIREMILNNENKDASHFIAKFAHLIRVTLEQSTQAFISLRNTIDYLQRYVEMEKIRNSNFSFQITADENLDLVETVLPPMLIQPFVENSIWHGVPNREKSISIHIKFNKSISPDGRPRLACIIEDNGIGINQSLKIKRTREEIHLSVGIQNIQNRIRLLNEKYNFQSSVIIEDKSDSSVYKETGTVVTLHMPLDMNF